MLPYWKWILVIVAFLAMQAFCDLSLPQYTSDIIDVGIMSSGVEHILPEEMTQEDFNRMMGVYLADLAKQEPGDWSADARSWAESNGIIQGDTDGAKRYKSFITREEAAAMLHRLEK